MNEVERLIRQRLDQANAQLAAIEADREVWLSVRDSDERLLRQVLAGKGKPGAQNTLDIQQIPATDTIVPSPAVVKSTKWPGAIREILQAARGAVLTTQTIYQIATQAGVKTESQDPIAQVDWNLSKMIREKTAPIERVRTQHYRWIGN